MVPRLLFFICILIASLINNLIVPYAIYYKKFGFFKKRPQGFIGVNFWGIIMDGILAGGINIIILNYLLNINSAILLSDLIVSILAGFFFMIICHIYMSVKKWKVWIMPKPWVWNLAGYWHMFSMTLQMSYVGYCFIIILRNLDRLTDSLTIFSVIVGFSLACLFILSLKQEKKGLKIGKVNISNKPW
jgi:hypothetical protein